MEAPTAHTILALPLFWMGGHGRVRQSPQLTKEKPPRTRCGRKNHLARFFVLGPGALLRKPSPEHRIIPNILPGLEKKNHVSDLARKQKTIKKPLEPSTSATWKNHSQRLTNAHTCKLSKSMGCEWGCPVQETKEGRPMAHLQTISCQLHFIHNTCRILALLCTLENMQKRSEEWLGLLPDVSITSELVHVCAHAFKILTLKVTQTERKQKKKWRCA